MKGFLRFHLDPTDAAHRQITRELRQQILHGKLKPGTRLPGLRELAKELGTNYFTVQTALTPLVREGLIERKPKLGTFVMRDTPLMTAVAIFCGSEISREGAAFYHTLCSTLFKRLTELGIEPRLFIDPRPLDRQDDPYPVLMQTIQKGGVQGLVGCMLSRVHHEWLHSLPLPVAVLTTGDFAYGVKNDARQMYEDSFGLLKQKGCRRIAMLTLPTMSHDADRLAAAEHCGIDLRVIQSELSDTHVATQAEHGYTLFRRLWDSSDRPEGLMVFPDGLVPGVITAILEQRIRVPEQLHVLFHGNREIPIHCPFPANWAMASVSQMADALASQLEDQVRNVRVSQILLPFEIVKAS